MKKLLMIAMVGIFLLTTFVGCSSTSRYYKMAGSEFRDIDYVYPVKYVDVRNIEIGYIDQGSGDRVILLIHGLGSNAKGWLKNIPALAKEYRVIAIDLPGYGISDKEAYQYSLSFYAEVLTEMLTKLDIDKATFVGHSMGGQIAMITSLNYPERVENLVLISPAGFERFLEGEGDWFKNVMTVELVHDTPTRNIDINLRSNFYDMPDDAAFMVTDRIQIKGAHDFEDYCYAVCENVGAMIDEPMWDRLDQISHKTLIMFGENDGLIPNPYLHGGKTKDIAKIGHDGIQNSRLVMLPKCGHFAQFEKFEQVNREILNLMTE